MSESSRAKLSLHFVQLHPTPLTTLTETPCHHARSSKAFGPGRCLGKMRCKRFLLTQRIERSKKRNLPSLMLAKSPGTGCGALKEEKGCGKIPPFPLCSRGASANLFQILFFLKRKVHSPICHAAAHSSLKQCRMHIAPHIMPYATTTL